MCVNCHLNGAFVILYTDKLKGVCLQYTIRYNISQLEDWVKGANLTKSGAIEALQPVIQASQLLQIRKKTEKDVNAIMETCTQLNTLQVGR